VKDESCFLAPEHNSDIGSLFILGKKNNSHGINVILLNSVILCSVRS
jgi:hypothetical protein